MKHPECTPNAMRTHPYRRAAVTALLALLCAGPAPMAAAAPHADAAGFQLVRVDPCVTDRAMTCDSTPLTGRDIPHEAYVPAHPPTRPRLAVFFPGTGARPAYYAPVAEALASAGWYVVLLRYVATTATENACPATPSPAALECYRVFRGETVFGENVPDPKGHAYNYPGGHIVKADSVMNRLLKLVAYLATHPTVAGAAWSGFQEQRNGHCVSFNTTYGACNLNWSRVAVGGHSQGAGVALYLSAFFALDRVVMLSGPEDADPRPGGAAVATWITDGHFATPASHIYGFTHRDDPFYARQTAVWAALHLPGPLLTYTLNHPLGAAHRVITTLTPGCPQLGAALAAHSATAVVTCVTLPAYATVWTDMFGPSH